MKYWDCFANNIEIIEPVSGQTGSILEGNDLGWKSLNYWLWIIVRMYPVNPVSMHFNREYILNINWVKYMSHVTIIFNLSLRNEQMVISLENIWTEPKEKKHILPTRKHIQLGSRFYRSTRRPPRRDDPLWEMSTRFCIILRQETGKKVKGHFHRSKIGSMSNGFVCTYILPIISSDQGSPDGPSPRW